MMLAVAAPLPAGCHTEDPDNGVQPDVERFTDYASAGNLWRSDNRPRPCCRNLFRGEHIDGQPRPRAIISKSRSYT